jgi:DNA topoisomerase I
LAELWIIEAPGKARVLEGILGRIGIEGKVQATKGHFMSSPDSLTPIGIDTKLHEFMREPKDIQLVKRIRDMAREVTTVVIATDADQEGDVIAWDVAEMIVDIHPSPMRVKMKGMDDDSVREAIAEASPVRKEDAVPGRTRAIVDRLIGATFSANGVAVGRVSTAILGLVNKEQPSVLRLNLSAPDKNGGRPWLAQTPINGLITQEIANRLAATQMPALSLASSKPFTAPPHHIGEIMVRASELMDLSPTETAKAMQRTYESGRLSYPRAGSKGMSKSASKKISKMLAKAAVRFDAAKVAEKASDEVHDAPHPLGDVNVNLDPVKMGADEGVRTMIARDLVRSGMKHTVENPITEPLKRHLRTKGFSETVAEYIAGLEWKREQGPRYPGQSTWQNSEVERRRPDAVLLETVLAAGVGRPSTWAKHIDGFLVRGLVDDNLVLTDKGRAWVKGSPPVLLDPRISVAIEKACERIAPAMFANPSREPWEMLAEKIISVLPAEISVSLRRNFVNEAPRPRRDFRALAEPGLDFSNLAREKEPGYQPPVYRPDLSDY